jgi:hypothetical protein
MKSLTMILIAAAVCAAQQMQYFQTPEDLQNALSEDEISFVQYAELIQLMEEKVDINHGNLYRLTIIPGVEKLSIDSLTAARDAFGPFRNVAEAKKYFPADFQIIESFVDVQQMGKSAVPGYIKIYTRRYFIVPHPRRTIHITTQNYILKKGIFLLNTSFHRKITNMESRTAERCNTKLRN